MPLLSLPSYRFWMLGLALLTCGGCRSPHASSVSTPGASRPLHGTGHVYFVPLATFPPALAQRLVGFYRQKYGMSIDVLPALQLTSDAGDPKRRQLIAQQLLAQIQRANARQASESDALLIGLTDVDMYSADTPDWKYVFAQQEGNQLAVVSSARLDPRAYGHAADDGLLQTRLQKMVSKKIGLMYYHLSATNDPHSVLYRSIMGPDDLDNMGEDF